MLNEVLPFVSREQEQRELLVWISEHFRVRADVAPGLARALEQERQMRSRPHRVWCGADKTLARFIRHYEIEYE